MRIFLSWSRCKTPAGSNALKAARNAPSHACSLRFLHAASPPLRFPQRRGNLPQAELTAPLSPTDAEALGLSPAKTGDPLSSRRCRRRCPAPLPQDRRLPAARLRPHKAIPPVGSGHGNDALKPQAPSPKTLSGTTAGLRGFPGKKTAFQTPTPCRHRPEPALAARPPPSPAAAGPYSPRAAGASPTPAFLSPAASLQLLAPTCAGGRTRGKGKPPPPRLRAAGEAAPTHPTCGSAAAAPSPPARLAPAGRLRVALHAGERAARRS